MLSCNHRDDNDRRSSKLPAKNELKLFNIALKHPHLQCREVPTEIMRLGDR